MKRITLLLLLVLQGCVSPSGIQPSDGDESQSVDSFDTHTKSCEGSPHGSIVAGYQSSVSFPGGPCLPATKTCIDGIWMGPEVFPSCTEPL